MLRLITIIFLFSAVTETSGQESSRLMSYNLGINFNYAGAKSPDFTLPVGVGLATSATLNKFVRFKPTIELSAVGFSEYVIHFGNSNNSDDSKYAYGVYNLLAGTKLKINKFAKVSLTTGPSFNSRENVFLAGLKPSIEFNSTKDKFLIQIYYLKIINSEILNGYTGLAFFFKLR